MLLDLRSHWEVAGSSATNRATAGTARVSVTVDVEIDGVAKLAPPTTFTSTQPIFGVATIRNQRAVVRKSQALLPSFVGGN